MIKGDSVLHLGNIFNLLLLYIFITKYKYILV